MARLIGLPVRGLERDSQRPWHSSDPPRCGQLSSIAPVADTASPERGNVGRHSRRSSQVFSVWTGVSKSLPKCPPTRCRSIRCARSILGFLQPHNRAENVLKSHDICDSNAAPARSIGAGLAIRDLERQIKRQRAALAHLDATIRATLHCQKFARPMSQ
jgi:hypothetical protein